MNKLGSFVLAIIFCQLAGLIGTIFTFEAIPTWYATLNKPFFSPPNWIFGPVWTILYTLMGISLWLIWQSKKNEQRRKALQVFGVQLLLNSLWSIIFFGLKNPLVAFIEILIMWGAIFLTIRYFSRLSQLAAWLLIPYLLWVSFATLLNGAIFVLNP